MTCKEAIAFINHEPAINCDTDGEVLTKSVEALSILDKAEELYSVCPYDWDIEIVNLFRDYFNSKKDKPKFEVGDMIKRKSDGRVYMICKMGDEDEGNPVYKCLNQNFDPIFISVALSDTYDYVATVDVEWLKNYISDGTL